MKNINNDEQLISNQPPSQINLDYYYTAKDVDVILKAMFNPNDNIHIVSDSSDENDSYLQQISNIILKSKPEVNQLFILPIQQNARWYALLLSMQATSITDLKFIRTSNSYEQLSSESAQLINALLPGLGNCFNFTTSDIEEFIYYQHPTITSTGPLLINNILAAIDDHQQEESPNLTIVREKQMEKILHHQTHYYRTFLNAQYGILPNSNAYNPNLIWHQNRNISNNSPYVDNSPDNSPTNCM